jgi:hypothetical protein
MRIEIYELRRVKDGYVIDEKRRVAVITVKEGRGSFHFYNKSREKLLRHLFDDDAVSLVGGGKTPDGYHVDAAVKYPAWSREAIELTVGKNLYSYNLGGRIITDE